MLLMEFNECTFQRYKVKKNIKNKTDKFWELSFNLPWEGSSGRMWDLLR